MSLRLSFLGPFQAFLDGKTLTGFDTQKTRALLAYLAVENTRPHSRETLAGLLWPDRPQSSALSSLRNALAHGYFSVDLAIVWQTIHNDLPGFRRRVQTALAAG